MRRTCLAIVVTLMLTGCEQTSRLAYRAYQAFDHGRYQQAVDGYQRVLALNPNWPNASYNLGRSYLALGQLEPALAALDEAAHQDPTNPRVLVARAEAYERSNQTEQAQRDLLKATRLAPEWVEGWQRLVDLQLRLERPEAALRTAERGLKKLPRVGALHRLRGESLLDLKHYAESELAFGKALEIDHEDILARGGRALARLGLDKLELARQDISDAQQLEPENPQLLLAKAEVQERSGQLPEARATLQQVLDRPGLDPDTLKKATKKAAALEERQLQAP
ncbi:MAG: tetratricopeptide repeat protein [Vulcanimicrobiota bacterium]